MERIDPSLLREVTPEEIIREFNANALDEINYFQTASTDENGKNPIERILSDNYFPTETIKKHTLQKLIGTLACNISLYEDALEDEIASDELIKSIDFNRLVDPDNVDNYAIALRIRRSILAVILSQTAVIEPLKFPINGTSVELNLKPHSVA